MVGQNAVPPAVERDMRPAVDGRMAQIWLTPHGFIKAAMAGNAAAKAETVRGAKKTAISFTTPSKVRLEGTLNEQNLVERIETWVDNPVLGDMLVEAVFSDYKDFGGVKFPTHILQREGGYPVLDLTITDVKPNAAAAIEVPANIRQAKAPAPAAIEPEKLSDGIWIIPGAAKSIAVEFRDHIVVIDAPETEARSIAVIDAIKKIIPGKPIRYVVNTHTHFDHAGGNTRLDESGKTIPSFPNARYFISLAEYEHAEAPSERDRASYFVDNWRPASRCSKDWSAAGHCRTARARSSCITMREICTTQGC